MRLPIRLRLTLVFTLSMALLLAVAGWFLYTRLAAESLRTIDAALLSEADAVAAGLGQQGAAFGGSEPGTARGLASVAQVLGPGGTVQESSQVAAAVPLVPARLLPHVRGPTYLDRVLHGIPGTTRMVVVPQESGQPRTWVVVGTSLQGRRDMLSELLALLLIGGPVTLAAASAVGWAVAGAALRPVERMRREAAAISVSDRGRRLPVPATRDEIARLGGTLNAMLSRLEAAFDRERRFVDDASHELRTPLALLKAELDLAQSRSRTERELRAAVRSASEETDRLTALAEALLVYSRIEGGRIPVHREHARVDEILRDACASLAPRAAAAGVQVRVDSGAVTAAVDPLRVRQVIENIVNNALAHTPRGGRVRASVAQRDGTVRLTVDDTGSGFDPDFIGRAFEPFARGSAGVPDTGQGSGLGLAIVQAIARAHGGHATAENLPQSGARVTVTFRAAP